MCMAKATHRAVFAAVLTSVAVITAGCAGSGTSGSRASTAAKEMPERIVGAPRDALSATSPQQDGSAWLLTGGNSAGLYQVKLATGHVVSSFSVSGAARSVAESSAGILGLGIATGTAGALELLRPGTGRVIRTVPMPAPVRQVVTGSDGRTFFVLTGWTTTASVTAVISGTGRVTATVPMPAEAVSVVPDSQQSALYVLQANGLVSQISIASGKVLATFPAGKAGRWIAISPDGSTLYVLKGTAALANIAVVDTETEGVQRVLPAPSNCQQLLVSSTGRQLYEVVGAPGYGNLQIFGV
jgi:hypothetical protein